MGEGKKLDREAEMAQEEFGAYDDMEFVPWPLNYRTDGRVEIICPHGTGHTSLLLTKEQGKHAFHDYSGTHGCDGCCGGIQGLRTEGYWLGQWRAA